MHHYEKRFLIRIRGFKCTDPGPMDKDNLGDLDLKGVTFEGQMRNLRDKFRIKLA